MQHCGRLNIAGGGLISLWGWVLFSADAEGYLWVRGAGHQAAAMAWPWRRSWPPCSPCRSTPPPRPGSPRTTGRQPRRPCPGSGRSSPGASWRGERRRRDNSSERRGVLGWDQLTGGPVDSGLVKKIFPSDASVSWAQGAIQELRWTLLFPQPCECLVCQKAATRISDWLCCQCCQWQLATLMCAFLFTPSNRNC